MNLKLQDEAAFFAEYQNEPLPEEASEGDELSADQIAGKFNRMPRRLVPIGCNHLTLFVDVQAKALFWLVAAWENDFTGYVVDYGTEPDLKEACFTLRDLRQTLALATPRAGIEGAIYAGLERLTARLLEREWRRDDGAMVRQWAVQGAGVAYKSRLDIQADLDSGRLIDLFPAAQGDPSPLYAVYPSRRYQPLRLQTLLVHLQSVFSTKTVRRAPPRGRPKY